MTPTTKNRTVDQIQDEIGAEQRKLAEIPPPPFEEQEEILKRIMLLLDERKEAGYGKG